MLQFNFINLPKQVRVTHKEKVTDKKEGIDSFLCVQLSQFNVKYPSEKTINEFVFFLKFGYADELLLISFLILFSNLVFNLES